jgi:hypothetical protein
MNEKLGRWTHQQQKLREFEEVVEEFGDDLEMLMLAEKKLKHRITVIRREKRKGSTSEAVEYVPYKDGHLQLTYHYTKKGTRRGPYYYFVYHEQGKQKSIYIGKCSVEEAKKRVDEKRNQ